MAIQLEEEYYDVISPDGFSIEREEKYDSPEEAEKALTSWMKRFEFQGYYSSNNGRIPLHQLRSSCQIITL